MVAVGNQYSAKKQLNFWDRLLIKISTQSWQKNLNNSFPQQQPDYIVKSEYAAKSGREISDNHWSNSLRWYKAHGGMIIEISTYNEKLHEWVNELYIVPEGGNLGEEISSIIMQQFLRS
jgi:hypothetical protein